MRTILLIMALAQLNTSVAQLSPDLLRFKDNKRIPKIIERNVLVALSHYPELEHTPIRFVFKKNLKSNIMQAQPRVTSFFKGRQERGYQINISSMLRLMHSTIPIHQLPDNIMIGWIGHELGHIMDYEQRGKLGLISFGFTYLLSKKHRIQGETVADTFAVTHGLGNYIIETKRFILNHAELPQAYKDKIARLYLSPDAIVEQVRKLEDKKVKAQLKVLKK